MESRLLPRRARILPSPRKRWVSVPGSVDIRTRRKDWRAGLAPLVGRPKPKKLQSEKSRITGSSRNKVPWIPQTAAKSELLGWVIPRGAHSELLRPLSPTPWDRRAYQKDSVISSTPSFPNADSDVLLVNDFLDFLYVASVEDRPSF